MFQFWFLQFLILLGAFGSGKGKVQANRKAKGKAIGWSGYHPKVKAFLFILEGLLLMAIAWIWKEEPKHVPLLYLFGGIVWVLAGLIFYLYLHLHLKKKPLAH